MAQIPKDFGISESCLNNWLRAADIEDEKRSGVTREGSAKLGEQRKRNRLLEQENEVLRRAAAYLARGTQPKMIYPVVRDLAATAAPVRVPRTLRTR